MLELAMSCSTVDKLPEQDQNPFAFSPQSSSNKVPLWTSKIELKVSNSA
jgi:hypothetical protein